MIQLQIIPLLCRVGGALVFGLALTLSVPSMAQETVVSPDETAKAPSVTDAFPNAARDKKDGAETIDLLTDDLTQHWKVFSSAPIPPNTSVWKVVREGEEKELILICSGEPKGFLYTTEPCSEFELTLEWKYPKDADGNSGVLVYTQYEPRIWPTSMQVQLHQPKAGSVFPSGDALSDHSSEADLNLARPVNTWNECRIVSQNGRLKVEVNGKKAGEVSGAKPASGSIALQSEGSIVHFRRIRLRKLPVTDPEANSEAVPGRI